MTTAELWRRGQRGWPARFPLVQFPNAPLLIAFGGSLVAGATDGTSHAAGRAVFYAGLSAWAWEEIADGANWFRRVVGAGGFVYVVVRVAALI